MKTLTIITAFALSISIPPSASANSANHALYAGASIVMTGISQPGSSLNPYTNRVAQANAQRMARSYIAYAAFSRTGLIEQLVFEGFSNSVSTKAVDSLRINWNKQAGKMAKSYLEYSAFSRQGLLDQLIFEGFTQNQALSGLRAVGY